MEIGHRGDVNASDDTTGRPRKNRMRRSLASTVERHETARGIHHHDGNTGFNLKAPAWASQQFLQRPKIGLHHRPEIGIQNRRAAALEFTKFGYYLRRCANKD